MNISVSPRLKTALALLLVLAVYFKSIGNPLCPFDDRFIVEHYGLNGTNTFRDIITPGGSFYYRPLVNLSYWLDFRLWEFDPTYMHLENIAAHLLNVLLVFLIAERLSASFEAGRLPLFCALLFGLHPINSEPVNWIAGRTDLFAGMFVLSAFYFLVRALQERSTRCSVLAFVLAFAGTLAKETAVMFIPVAFLAAVCWPGLPRDDVRFATWRKRFLLFPLLVSSGLVLLVLLLVHSKGHGNTAISMILEGGTDLLMRPLGAFGFYVRKMFLPTPLNVAIMQVNSAYALLGILVFGTLALTCRRTSIAWIMLASAVLFTLPSLLVAVNSFAWTPIGERYLYIPSAFAVIGCLEISQRCLSRWNKGTWFAPLFVMIVSLAALITFQRSRQWGDNLELVRDAVAKSPHFGVVLCEYGVLLKQAGRYQEAEAQFRAAAEQKNKADVDRVIHLNLVGMKLLGKNSAEARAILLKEIGSKPAGDVELLKLLSNYTEGMFYEAVAADDRRRLVADFVETNRILYQKTHDPFYLYRSGQLALSVGDNREAAALFRKTWEQAPTNAYYRESARILAEKLMTE